MNNKIKAERTAKTYIKTGMNATETARQLYPNIKNKARTNQTTKGHEIMTNPDTQTALKELMEEDDSLNNKQIQKLLNRNAQQTKSLQASNTALDIALKVKGEYAPQKKINIDVSPDNINQLLKEQQREIQRLLKEKGG